MASVGDCDTGNTGVPHEPQKRLLSGFSVRHEGQRIGYAGSSSCPMSLRPAEGGIEKLDRRLARQAEKLNVTGTQKYLIVQHQCYPIIGFVRGCVGAKFVRTRVAAAMSCLDCRRVIDRRATLETVIRYSAVRRLPEVAPKTLFSQIGLNLAKAGLSAK
jgi:hypothetical protein